MKAINLAWAGIWLATASLAQAEQRPLGAGIAPLYAHWLSTKAQCDRHGAWTMTKNTACDRWYEATDDLARHGWCFGGTAALEPWHICNADDSRSAAQTMAANSAFAQREANVIRAMSPPDRVLYKQWATLDRPCEAEVTNIDCRGLVRIERTLNMHGWCRFSPISRADEFWHRCLPGDAY